MKQIDFAYKGNKFEIDVDDSFTNLPEEEQVTKLSRYIEEKYGEKRAHSKKSDKGLLDYLGLIERPIQALKVGAKESDIGGNVFRSMGGIDLTPEEGFFTGLSRGWHGEDEVRTQDFLPDDMNPITKGILGFAGDVATDPLTYMGGTIFKGGAALAGAGRRAIPRSVAAKMGQYKDKFVDDTLVGNWMQDVARGMNIPLGSGKAVKGLGTQSAEQTAQRGMAMTKALNELRDAMARRASESGEDIEKIHFAFRNYSERAGKWDENSFKFTPAKREELSKEMADKVDSYKETMGEELTELADNFQETARDFLNIERSYGLGVSPLTERGYFPHAITPHGRQRADIRSEIDPVTFARLNAGYMYERAGKGTVDMINQEKLAELGSKTPNPADLPWEIPFGERVLHTDPTIAWGRRWNQHLDSLQRKWYLDEITDVDLIGDKAAGFSRYMPATVDAAGRLAQPRVHGFGRWLKRDAETGRWDKQRIRSEHGDSVWRPIDDDMNDWVDVDFIKPKSEHSDAWYKKEAFDRAKVLEKAARDKAINLGFMLDDKELKKIADEAIVLATKEMDAVKLNETYRFVAPKQIKKQMENTFAMMTGDKEINTFLKVYDKLQDTWKSWTLAIRPGYHTRNAVGNVSNAYMITGLGENIPKAVATFKNAAKVQYYSRFDGDDLFRQETIANLRNVRGTKMSKVDRAVLNRMPKINSKDWDNPNFAGTGFSMREIAENAKMRGVNAGHYHKDILRDLETKAEIAADPSRKAKLEKFFMDNPLVEGGFAFGGTIEGNARYAVFLHELQKIQKNPSAYSWIAPTGEKVPLDKVASRRFFKPDLSGEFAGPLGVSRTERAVTREDAIFDIASQRVKEALFDYTDLSKFERNVMKRIFPFYTWTRKNIPAQLKVLVQNPQRAEKVEIARQQFEHNTGGYDQSEVGKFWGERVPVFFGDESNGVVKAFTLLNTLPMADLQRVLNPQHLIAEMVSPIPKSLFEQIFNYDSFRSMAGRPKKIKEDYETSKDFLGVGLPPRLWHLAQLIVPLTELNRANPMQVFGSRTIDPKTRQIETTDAFFGLGARRESNPADIPEAARWFRFFSGFRVYDVDVRKQKHYKKKSHDRDLGILKSKLKGAKREKKTRKAEQILAFIQEVERQNRVDP